MESWIYVLVLYSRAVLTAQRSLKPVGQAVTGSLRQVSPS